MVIRVTVTVFPAQSPSFSHCISVINARTALTFYRQFVLGFDIIHVVWITLQRIRILFQKFSDMFSNNLQSYDK